MANKKMQWRAYGPRTFQSEHQMSALAGRVVGMSSTGKVFVVSANTTETIGVCVDGGTSAGSPVVVFLQAPVVQAEAAGAINELAFVVASDGGRVAATTTSGDNVLGISLTNATASGQLVDVMLRGPIASTWA